MAGPLTLIQSLWQSLIENTARPIGSVEQPLLDSAAIADLRRRALSLSAQSASKPVLHRQHGEHLSPRRGYGLDYEESRRYQPGDEMRFMNWRLTARTGESYTKVFREERQTSACILLDWRQSMRFGTHVRLKAAQALRAAVLLAFYCHFRGRSVAAIKISGELRWLKGGGDEAGVTGMVADLNRACPPWPAGEQPLDLQTALRAVQSASVAGSELYLISDFYDADSNCESVLAQFAAEHEVCAIHIVDPAEERLPKAGILRLSSAVSHQERRVNLSNPHIAAQFQGAAQRHLADREDLLRGLGIRYARLLTIAEDIETLLAFTSSTSHGRGR